LVQYILGGVAMRSEEVILNQKRDLEISEKCPQIVRKKDLVTFLHPEGGYIPGQEWADRYYHIITPEKARCVEMYRYDLHGYSYGMSAPMHIIWCGYLFENAAPSDLILNEASNVIFPGGVSARQYIGPNNNLILSFGPMKQYYNSFTLDYQSGSTGERVIHDPSFYKVILTDRDTNITSI
jgi:hypothetical protein